MHSPNMARYYFNLYNDHTAIDAEGTDLPDDAAAHERAIREARYMAAESVKSYGHLVKHHRIAVVNQAGEEVATVRFGDVVSVID
jgi:hypothetical protein